MLSFVVAAFLSLLAPLGFWTNMCVSHSVLGNFKGLRRRQPDLFLVLERSPVAFYFSAFGQSHFKTSTQVLRSCFLFFLVLTFYTLTFQLLCVLLQTTPLPCQFFSCGSFLSTETYHPSCNLSACNGQCFLAFNPVGKCHVTLHAPSVSAAHGAQEWRVFPGFCEMDGVLGWHGNVACWPGMNWLAHCVPDRETQMQE